MNCYKENICRICKKVFCCKKCRKQHESLIHKIFVDCNICLYGKTFLKDPPERLIEHIKSNHWPLHCVICKYTFTSLGELLEQNKCVETKNQDLKRSPYTPIQSQDESPLYFSKEQKAITSKSMFPNVATSTPLQRQEDNNLPEKSNEEVITPVDFSDINKDKKYFTDSVSIKRKVTFCETPITDVYEKQKELLRPEHKCEDQIIVTPNSGNSPAVFYSAKQCSQKNSAHESDKNEVNNAGTKNKHSLTIEKQEEIKNIGIGLESSSLWISAISTSPANSVEENKPCFDVNYTTPMIAKLKRRQINVVIKTEVMKKHGELQLPTDLRLPILNISESEENILQIHQDDNESHKSSEKVDVINTSTPSNVTDAHEVLSEACVNAPARLWTSMSRIIKSVTNAVQEISNVTYNSRTPLKRSMPECDLLDGPCIKRYKLTEIKCRRPIRQSTIMEHLEENYENSKNENIAGEIKKIFVDKATQTDDELTGLKFVKIAP